MKTYFQKISIVVQQVSSQVKLGVVMYSNERQSGLRWCCVRNVRSTMQVRRLGGDTLTRIDRARKLTDPPINATKGIREGPSADESTKERANWK
jgi:hypothetical protein